MRFIICNYWNALSIYTPFDDSFERKEEAVFNYRARKQAERSIGQYKLVYSNHPDVAGLSNYNDCAEKSYHHLYTNEIIQVTRHYNSFEEFMEDNIELFL